MPDAEKPPGTSDAGEVPDEAAKPTGRPTGGAPAPKGQAAKPAEGGQPAPGRETISPEDLDAVLRAAGVDASAAYAGSDLDLQPLAGKAVGAGAGSIDMLRDVALNVRIELGRTRMFLEDVLRLGAGAVITLDRLAGDAVDVLVNGQLVARGEVIIVDDNFCVRITEIVSTSEAGPGPPAEDA